MLSPDNQDWLMSGHDIIFDNIMTMIGLSSLESLHRCRQVCRTWNAMIMKNMWENPSKRNIIKIMYEKKWAPGMLPSEEDISHAKWLESRGILDIGLIGGLVERVRGLLRRPSDLPEINCAASLARYDLLGPVGRLTLSGDLTSVPAEHLSSLVSCVTESVDIQDVTGCGLLTILDCVKGKLLVIKNQSLGSEETRALVRAMESRVGQVVYQDDRTLDIRAVMEYSGQGMCRMIRCFCRTEMWRYRDQLRTWAKSRNWRVTYDGLNSTWYDISMTNCCLSEYC